MLIFKTQEDLKTHLQSDFNSPKSVGFVPTMGALHRGHLSLIEKSISENDLTVMSIFVNPTQFNNQADLENYPRTLEADVEKLKQVSDKIIVFAPSVEEIYQGNTQSQNFDFDGLEHEMEGKHRPGHFDGVGTIVKRLFEIVQPDKAYFGEKDFQQLQIVKKMVAKNHLPVEVIGQPIFREENGLAMSSRNERLSKIEREEASFIYKTLQEVKNQFGIKNATELTIWIEDEFKNKPNFKLEYFEIADESTLKSIQSKEPNKKYRAFIAVFMNDVRLIDTISLN
ncbi:pantoate--beta-alanine ligase [Flavobacterium antarcticum]|uniref:pantoate--beta-alanine ligase n=1 Tax=Flavobacterium antarcticum TaxID=271155 RepID=UPI0003B6C774|nr:pantoate--beta-alanine ligase [Flavobacterium antarcticum]